MHVHRYSGLLDYVWYEPARLAVRRVLPQPPAAELAGWLPSQRHPSDHLAVVADLEWCPRPVGLCCVSFLCHPSGHLAVVVNVE